MRITKGWAWIGLAVGLASGAWAAEFEDAMAEADRLVDRLVQETSGPWTAAEKRVVRAFVGGTCARAGSRFALYQGWGPFRRLTPEGKAVFHAAAGFAGALDHLELDTADEALVAEAEHRLLLTGRFHETKAGALALRSFGYLQNEAEEMVRQAVMLDLQDFASRGGAARLEAIVAGEVPAPPRAELETMARHLRGRLAFVDSYGGFEQANPARRDADVARARAAYEALTRWLRGEAPTGKEAALPAQAPELPTSPEAPTSGGGLLGT